MRALVRCYLRPACCRLRFSLFSLTLLLGVVLATLGIPGAATAAEPTTAPQLRLETGMHTAMINRIATDASGRYAVTASDDKTARVWEIASGQLLQVLRPPLGSNDEGMLYAVAISPDGKIVAVGGWTGWEWSGKAQVYLFERSTGRLIQRLTDLPHRILNLMFSPDGRWLAATLKAGKGVRVWNTNTWDNPLADSDYVGDSYGSSFSHDGRLATTDFEGQIRLYQLSTNSLKLLSKTHAISGRNPYGIAFSPNGQLLAVGYDDLGKVDVLDAHTLDLRFNPEVKEAGNGNLMNVAWRSDGQVLWAGGLWDIDGFRQLRQWAEAGQGQVQNFPLSSNGILALTALPEKNLLVGGAEPFWGRITANGKNDVLRRSSLADLRDQEKIFAIDSEASQVQFGFEQFGKIPHWFDLRRRQLNVGTNSQLSPHNLNGLTIQGWKNTDNPTLFGGALPMQKYEISHSLAVATDTQSFVLGTAWSLRLFNANTQLQWKNPVPGNVWGVNIAANGKVVVAAYGDGTIRWHRLLDGQELLAFFPHADRKRWVLWTPSGYYDASPGAEELIGWHVNRGQDNAADFYPASRFRERFHRPDVIDRVLDTLDENQALAQADAERGKRTQQVSIAQVLPPSLDLLSPAEGSFSNTSLTVRYQVRSAGDAPVTAVRVRVNGQMVETRRDLAIAAIGGSQQTTSAAQTLTIPLPKEDAEIQLFAENRHGVSTPATLRYRFTGARPQPVENAPLELKPKLYVLAVGVSEYDNPDYRLGLAAKDAKDLAAVFQRQKGLLYRDVEVRLLTDKAANRDAVMDGLEWLQRQVTARDVGVLFLAGHGINAPDGAYYFAPANFNLDSIKRTGVVFNEVKSTLSNLAGKAVFFVDTCHSGNVLGAGRRALGSDITGIINELTSAENGVVVFSSATGREYALEKPEWGNGAFTKALVEGLSGKADHSGSGRITHKGLDYYLSERVKALTNGQQHPVTQAPGGVPDFPLAVMRR